MTPKTRNLLAGLAAVAVVVVVGALVFDRQETRAYSECMDGAMTTFGSYSDSPDASLPDGGVVDFVYVSGCDDANRVGLVVAGLGVVALVATTVRWWALRCSSASRAGRD
ncbi:DUF2029 domain-containing protein [Rhodococcus sp. TAF43]|uniref:DUF2029 domain-containing protein n=1 Tax=unclassified Rhodococcus (in: high G+C Gram-positive bacteria) TaxID=192944 RepID=UPI000E0A027F|nr:MULTISPECIES: DUF2029 domain-containing protein [unclassified Rhodococcus (in: high G+C Gram-positive bacteria)]QKT11585.1 DUF2029 domain-containing protein [Rhodococcus sp. W8901]RDI20009.1 uncharacterized protein DUF2029 [Rhodococcus sp. AG1013]